MATELVSSDYRVWWQAEDCETCIAGITNAGILETLGGFNIDVDFTTGEAIAVDIDAPLASDAYVYGIDVDLQQTAAYAGTWSTSGGMIAVRADVHIDMQITDAYAGYFNVYVDPAATCTVNDAVGVLANVTLVGPFTQGAATSSIAALKGMISNTSTGSYDGQVYNIMLSYGSNVNYGDDTALIMGYTHADARCDYGFYLKNYSPYMVAGIYLTEVAGASPAMGHGLLITADCTTAAIQLGVSGTPAGDFVWHGTTALYAVTFDIDGDTNGSVLFGADTKGLMVNLYGDVTGCGVFWDPSTDTNGTLSVGASGGSKGNDFFVYGKLSGSFVEWDQDANDAGRFKVVNASTRLTCSRDGINECAFSITQTHDTDAATGDTQGGNAAWITYNLATANTNASESGYTLMTGVHGDMLLDGTINGDQVHAVGVMGEIRGAGAITECAHIAAVYAKNNNAISASAGDKSLFYGENIAGTVNYGVLLEGAMATGISLSGATGLGVSVTMAVLTAGDAYSGVRSTVTAAAASNGYGTAAYFDTTLTGTNVGHVWGAGSWVNLASGATIAGGGYIVAAQDNGFYDGGGTLTGRVVYGLRAEYIADSVASDGVFMFSTNSNNQEVTALFETADNGPSLSYAVVAGTSSTKVGDICIAQLHDGTKLYIRVYDSAT